MPSRAPSTALRLGHRSSHLGRQSPTPPPSGGRLGGGNQVGERTRQFPPDPGLPPSWPPPAGGRSPARARRQEECLTDVLGGHQACAPQGTRRSPPPWVGLE